MSKKLQLLPGSIVITETRFEEEALHLLAVRPSFKRDFVFPGQSGYWYDKEWSWWWDGNILSGSTGYEALKTMILLHPNAYIVYLQQLELPGMP